MKEIEWKLLSELMKNSKRSDRELAKAIGSSQPTVSRTRKRLEKELLLDYTTIPDLGKLGFDILAFTFARWDHRVSQDEKISEALAFLSEHPDILFVSTGSGLNSDRVCLSIHKDFTGYTRLMSELRAKWEKYFTIIDSFIVSLKGDNVLRQLTFKHLGRLLEETSPSSSVHR